MVTATHPNEILECSVVRDKPVRQIRKLINSLSLYAMPRLVAAKTIIPLSETGVLHCHLLLRGTVALARISDGFVIHTEKAPYIFGLGNIKKFLGHLCLIATEESEISIIPTIKTNILIEQANLWQELAFSLMYTSGRLCEHTAELVGQSSYDIIRNKLYELLSETPETRLNITAANYILKRTFLSRSCVMKILAQLKKGGYITTQRGILLEIDKTIPLRY